jgi:hypothetical protein
VVPVTIAILVGLFAVQRYGSGRVGRLFGPILALWFVAIAILGAAAIPRDPSILAAINPAHAVGYFARHGLAGIPILGAVVLCLTGGERCTPTWVTSGPGRSGCRGSRSSSRRWCSAYLGRRGAAREPGGGPRARSTRPRRRACCIRWSSWRPRGR